MYRGLTPSQLSQEFEAVGLKVQTGKTYNQKMTQINNFVRSNHPLKLFLESLAKEELNSLYKYYDIKGKNIKILYLSSKIFSVSPQNPIQAAVTALSEKQVPQPNQLLADPTLGNSHFEGLPLQNPNTTCYLNAAINSLAGCDMVRQILTHPQISDTPDFYSLLINQLPAENKAPQTPESMRDAVKQIFTSLSNIVHKKAKSATGLRNKFSKVFEKFRTGQHDSTEFILKLAQTNSLLGDLFKFTVEEKKRCRICGNEENIGVEGNLDIKTRNSLNIMPTPHPTDIQSLIDAHLQSEERVGENKVECARCKTRQDTDLIKQVGTHPTVLAVRVSRDAIGLGYEFAPNVPVTPNEIIVFNNTSYRVKSIIEHLGGNPQKPLESGHYIAYLHKNSKWIRCDDRIISETSSAPQKGLLFLYERADIEAPAEVQPQSEIQRPEQVEPQAEHERSVNPCILVTHKRPRRNTRADSPPAKRIVMEKEGIQDTPLPKKVYKKKKPAPIAASSSESSSTSDEENSTSKEYRDRQRQIYNGMKKFSNNMREFWQWSEPCKICLESWPGMKIRPKLKICDRCANERNNTRERQFPTFSLANDMIPSEPPDSYVQKGTDLSPFRNEVLF